MYTLDQTNWIGGFAFEGETAGLGLHRLLKVERNEFRSWIASRKVRLGQDGQRTDYDASCAPRHACFQSPSGITLTTADSRSIMIHTITL